ncbi:MAG: ornithine cyclodeaminase family protein [Proteobacteria bacterium]|nr:ornithine cyclodeaminase family protein [Pseudomonadota bacterium]MDA1310135.1 ornithine cyclodeaminase family protein [Pseudomonadota bacterium]
MPALTVLTEAELRQCVTLDAALIETIADGFKALAMGQASSAPAQPLLMAGAGEPIRAKTAFIHGSSNYALKVGPTGGAGGGALMLFNTGSSQIETLLLDNGYLAKLQAAAAGAVAAKFLARKAAKIAGILGTATDAFRHAEALLQVRNIETMLIWDTDSAAARALATRIETTHAVTVEVLDTAQAVVQRSDIVVTATRAISPIVISDWLHPGLHITAVGADVANKNELAPEVLAEADLYVADLREQCRWSGELTHAIGAGLINDSDRITELGEIVAGQQPGREHEEEITVADLTGSGIQDAAIAVHAVRLALARGFGTTVAID